MPMKFQQVQRLRNNRLRIGSLALCILAFSIGVASSANIFDFSFARRAMLSITSQETLEHITILASDRFEGRGAGTSGGKLAASYVSEQFSKAGLLPAGDNGKFYQSFSITSNRLEDISFTLSSSGSTTKLKHNQDFALFYFTGANVIATQIVFAGYGITAPEYGYDDYADLDVKGKIVLLLRHEPRENEDGIAFEGKAPTIHALFEEKARNAWQHGAAGMLVVTDPLGGHKSLRPGNLGLLMNGKGTNEAKWQLAFDPSLKNFPSLWVSGEVAEKILLQNGLDLKKMQLSIDRYLEPNSRPLPATRARIQVRYRKAMRTTQNVVAWLPGSDPDLRDEVVVVGAHYDHVGIQNGRIHNGADDNASGTSGLIEIAEAFASIKGRHRRSLLFIAFSAEELGLLGSAYYVEHPRMPLNKTIAMINLDMISRNHPDEVSVIGSNRSPELHEINIRANEEIGLRLFYDGENYFYRSDQANFAKHDIPVLFYNTKEHQDYHRPSDDTSKVNPEKAAKIARLAFLVAFRLANGNDQPTFQPLSR